MSAPGPELSSLHLPGVEADPKPGAYRTLIETAKRANAEYSRIWDLFAFQNDFTVHLARFTQGGQALLIRPDGAAATHTG